MARLTVLRDYLDSTTDYDGVPDWQVAAYLNAPDPAYPIKIDIPEAKVAEYMMLQGKISAIKALRESADEATRELGEAAAMILDGRYSAAGYLGTSEPATLAGLTAQIQALVTLSVLSQDQADTILSMADGTQSWAAATGYGHITANDVSQARAGNLTYGE